MMSVCYHVSYNIILLHIGKMNTFFSSGGLLVKIFIARSMNSCDRFVALVVTLVDISLRMIVV